MVYMVYTEDRSSTSSIINSMITIRLIIYLIVIFCILDNGKNYRVNSKKIKLTTTVEVHPNNLSIDTNETYKNKKKIINIY